MKCFFEKQYNEGFYSYEELLNIGFASLGKNILLSRQAKIYTPSKISLGNYVRIDDFCILSGKIEIGDFVHLGAFSSITGGNIGVKIGDYCGMSSYSKIFALSDDFVNGYLIGPCIPNQFRHIIAKEVVLTKHSHIGSHSLVMPGSVFEIGSCLGPMSLNLGRKFKKWNYYCGNPAKSIYTISSERVLSFEKEMLLNIMGGGGKTIS
ncbi:galactoside O-acetyltransferase [Helicobacter enhydrae]|uniref:Galactoside O-acetyltransferase n=1 Tax=Helicobacter enhydrae TaxID=222136 RepID=A0A1B1U5H5_9HELI|nr:galactoside O-acetyltransferase [Helicobacter enhydrae]ANV98008.1 galactoside O-acetyltransferase [Helicobacter enhydrae]